ncbi:MAG: hypothetical protein FJW23_12125 [Acidimicrobiia bacterium]|nr:hypothetical protein [Acidimicrobiia bacterium]
MTDDRAGSDGEYCRAVEAHLCRRNDGHLIRIVGPSFERVCGWRAKGVPLRVAFQGIDRTVARHQARARRRPVQIDFCDADVLEAFDEWRRAVGVSTGSANAEGGEPSVSGGRRESLASHLDRVIARLTACRAGEATALHPVLDDVIRELDAARAGANGARGRARAALLDRLRELDAVVAAAARGAVASTILPACEEEADAELAPFRAGMTGEHYARAHAAAVDRLVRERLKLPTLVLSLGGWGESGGWGE